MNTAIEIYQPFRKAEDAVRAKHLDSYKIKHPVIEGYHILLDIRVALRVAIRNMDNVGSR